VEEEDGEGRDECRELYVGRLDNVSKLDSEVQWHMQDFVNREAFHPLFEEPTGSEIGGYHPGKSFKLAASQSPSKNCRAAAVGKTATRRLISRIILESVVNASSRRRRGLVQDP